MKIKFKNDSSIKSIGDVSDVKRSQRGEEQIAKVSKQIQYWQRNPDKYVEFITGKKLPWYKKVLVRLSCLMEQSSYYKLWRRN